MKKNDKRLTVWHDWNPEYHNVTNNVTQIHCYVLCHQTELRTRWICRGQCHRVLGICRADSGWTAGSVDAASHTRSSAVTHHHCSQCTTLHL